MNQSTQGDWGRRLCLFKEWRRAVCTLTLILNTPHNQLLETKGTYFRNAKLYCSASYSHFKEGHKRWEELQGGSHSPQRTFSEQESRVLFSLLTLNWHIQLHTHFGYHLLFWYRHTLYNTQSGLIHLSPKISNVNFMVKTFQKILASSFLVVFWATHSLSSWPKIPLLSIILKVLSQFRYQELSIQE